MGIVPCVALFDCSNSIQQIHLRRSSLQGLPKEFLIQRVIAAVRSKLSWYVGNSLVCFVADKLQKKYGVPAPRNDDWPKFMCNIRKCSSLLLSYKCAARRSCSKNRTITNKMYLYIPIKKTCIFLYRLSRRRKIFLTKVFLFRNQQIWIA